MKKLQPVLNRISFMMPTSMTIRLTGQQLFIPVYHTLQGGYHLPHIKHLYPPKTSDQFEKDLDFLLKYYRPISLNDVFKIQQGEQQLKKNSFHLTFDDGLREVYEFALPILKRKGIPATVFLNSAFVDNQDLFFRYKASLLIEQLDSQKFSKTTLKEVNFKIGKTGTDLSATKKNILSIGFTERNILESIAELLNTSFNIFLKKQKPYLTTEQIHDLHNNSFTLGAHSINHPRYSEISFEEKIRQTKESIHFVQSTFNPKIRAFAFPFNDENVGQDFFQKIKNEKIVDLTFASNIFSNPKTPHQLQRFPMEGNLLNTSALFNFKSLYYFAKKNRS